MHRRERLARRRQPRVIGERPSADKTAVLPSSERSDSDGAVVVTVLLLGPFQSGGWKRTLRLERHAQPSRHGFDDIASDDVVGAPVCAFDEHVGLNGPISA